MRPLFAIVILLGAGLLLAGCLGGNSGTGGSTPSGGGTAGGGAGGTQAGAGSSGGSNITANPPTVDTAGASDFENPVSSVTDPNVDATDEEFPLPA